MLGVSSYVVVLFLSLFFQVYSFLVQNLPSNYFLDGNNRHLKHAHSKSPLPFPLPIHPSLRLKYIPSSLRSPLKLHSLNNNLRLPQELLQSPNITPKKHLLLRRQLKKLIISQHTQQMLSQPHKLHGSRIRFQESTGGLKVARAVWRFVEEEGLLI